MLAPAGRVDHATADDFRVALLDELTRCTPSDHVVLDFARVDYIASVGLRALSVASKQVRAHGGTLAVAALQPLVQEVFEITKFTVLVTTYTSVREALAAVSPPALAAFDQG